MYIDVPTSTNLVRDDKIAITVVPSQATVTFNGQKLTFSVVDGVSRIAATGLGDATFADGDQIIVRTSVQDAANSDPAINNDGVYTIIDGSQTGYITVEEPVIAAVSTENGNIDEIDTFIFHPTKRIEQICVYIDIAGSDPATCQVSFVPGDFWAASTKKNIPETQGDLEDGKNYMVQVESAKYLQTKEEELIAETDSNDDAVMRKGTILMRVFPPVSVALTSGVDVALIQLC